MDRQRRLANLWCAQSTNDGNEAYAAYYYKSQIQWFT